MTLEPGMVLTLGATCVAGLVWLIRLEGRINLNESVTKALSEDIQYVRARIDRALNGKHD